MKSWKSMLLALALALPMAGLQAGVPLDKAPRSTNDTASLQNGAKLFVNYCLSCHSAGFMRYTRLRDLGLTDEDIQANLLFTGGDLGATMTAAISPEQAKDWFGVNPPDLTLIARSRTGSGGSGADYVYTLLRNYYRDPGPVTGWNNLLFPNIAMPHPMWELQGERSPIYAEHGVSGSSTEVFTGRWQQDRPGALSAEEYDSEVADLANFLQWMAEPVRNKRVRIGVWVMIFLLFFTFVAMRLNAAYWKDVE